MRHADRRYVLVLGLLGVLTAAVVLVQAEVLVGALTGAPDWWALIAVVAARALVVTGSRIVTQREAATVKALLRKRLLRDAAARRGARAGEVTTLVVRGLDAVEPYFAGYLPQLVVAVTVPVAVLVRLSFADLGSALPIVATLPLIPVFAALVGKHTRDRTRRQWDALVTLGGHFLDVVRGSGTLRMFGRARAQARTVRAMADAHRAETMRTLRVAFLSALVLELVATLSVALVAVPVGLRLLDGGVTLHVALLVLLLAPEAYLPLRAAGAQFHASAEGLAVLENAVSENAATRPAAATAAGRPPDLRTAEIVFDHVTVHYPDRDAPALADFVLRVRPGERIALVGPSGAGKSTVLGLLLGEVAPTSGRVLVDGVDLRELDRAAWLRQLAWVPQRPTLFPGTVGGNIALGGPGDVREAASAVGVAHLLDERHPLSSGERQRVAVARALVRPDARLLLLDEPTARLDNGTEETVLRAAREWSRTRTALLVAHRPALLDVVDRIVEVR
ncbi:thiol reductant ABC exporter subunit CydD [Saccharothrix violaceirubra]|uniref:Thiol reductant ABC exporter CydD subunit n=1 Tax=Saccharothrix violaceirubra TaxID=413306 RepID=A0A7W7T8Q9_9PSEU|nr:thiol reductant ABC exporter subunit CydD [Saccharothrix violaceirubra]MBB4968411.1 thiol reductant ABC exporter CydD subunit [Saccharothrix violaceirubra]